MESQSNHFTFLDYLVFSAMLFLSTLVGLYFGYQDHKRNKNGSGSSDTENYLMGDRKMKIFPVAMSLTATVISGISLLGTSTEIYLYGTTYFFTIIAIALSSVIINFTIIPVLHDLKITSSYEYLEARFDRKLQLFGSISFTILQVLWLPIVLYVPALAFNQTTGINIHIITSISMCICIFYTCLGGLKAVIWTDVLQISLMYGTLTLIAVKGTLSIGGISVLFERNFNGGRLEIPSISLDPTIRHSVWTILIGSTLYWTSLNGMSQNTVQRYLSLKSIKNARKTLALFTISTILMIILCTYNGLLLYATYHSCDPLSVGIVKAKDQMMPHLVVQVLSNYPGLPGLFVAGVFSASLSSASTALNSLSAIVLKDFCPALYGHELSRKRTGIIMRGTVIILGILSVLLVYVVQNLGIVLQLALSIIGTFGGPLVGIFFVGMTMPWIGSRATFYSAIISLSTVSFIILKAQMAVLSGDFKITPKQMRVDGCGFNTTDPWKNDITSNDRHFYQISYLYYTPIGIILVIVLSLLFSLIFGFENLQNVDEKLVAPFLRKFLRKWKENLECNGNVEFKNDVEMLRKN